MQQHESNALIHEEEQKLNRLEREERVPRYKFVSPLCYQEEHEDEKLEERTQNFEPQIDYVVEQEGTTQGFKMSRWVELVLVTRQETIVLLKVEPIITKGIPMAIKIKYSEPKFNQQSGGIVRGDPKD